MNQIAKTGGTAGTAKCAGAGTASENQIDRKGAGPARMGVASVRPSRITANAGGKSACSGIRTNRVRRNRTGTPAAVPGSFPGAGCPVLNLTRETVRRGCRKPSGTISAQRSPPEDPMLIVSADAAAAGTAVREIPIQKKASRTTAAGNCKLRTIACPENGELL